MGCSSTEICSPGHGAETHRVSCVIICTVTTSLTGAANRDRASAGSAQPKKLKITLPSEGSFPTLARMARDFLAIPATSVSVE